MDRKRLDPGTVAALQRAERMGAQLFAVGPMTPGEVTPTPQARAVAPGMVAQVAHRGLLVPGYGATADDAVMNALGKIT